MQEPAIVMHQRRRLGDRLDHAGLVVCRLERDENPLAARPLQSRGKPGKVDNPLAIHGNPLHLTGRKAVPVEHAGVLGRADEEERCVPVADPPQRRGQHGICRFRPAAREDDVPGAAADQRRDLLPRPLDRAPGGAALGVHRGGVAGESKRARHRRRDLGPDRRRGIVVEIAARRAHRLPFTGESILAPDPGCRAKARSPHQRDAPGGAEFHLGPVQFRTILSRFGRHLPSSQGSRRSLCAHGARPAPVRG